MFLPSLRTQKIKCFTLTAAKNDTQVLYCWSWISDDIKEFPVPSSVR